MMHRVSIGGCGQAQRASCRKPGALPARHAAGPMLARMAGSKESSDGRHLIRPSLHAECDHDRGWWPCLAGPDAEQVRAEIEATGDAGGRHPWPQDRAWPIPGGEVRVLPRSEQVGDRSDIYVLDVLGLTVLVRVRDGDTFVHIDGDGMGEIQRMPVVVEVFNGGESSHGEAWDYCDGCGALVAKGGEVLDGDGYDGRCAACADKAEAEAMRAEQDAELEAGG